MWLIAVLMGLFVPALGHARREAQRVKCVAGLQGFGRAFSHYFNDFDAWPLSPERTDVRLQQVVLDDALAEAIGSQPLVGSDGVVQTWSPWVCPADRENGPVWGMSYRYIVARHLLQDGIGSADAVPSARLMGEVRARYENFPSMPVLYDFPTSDGPHQGNPYRRYIGDTSGLINALYADGSADWAFRRWTVPQ